MLSVEKALQMDAIIVDTRSPSEYEHDHIPGSVNIPIFENNERDEIGKLYKADQKKAFNLGLEYYSKKLPNLVGDIRKLPDKPVVIYCFRGGMRSKAITQMADLIGYEAYQLEGGYKAYRAYVRENLYNYMPPFRFVVLWGKTGTAKTRIIQKLEPAIDLEGLAQHRSSLFGGIGLEPRSQKMFESLLFFELKKHEDEKFVFTEGESQKIGDVIIPNAVYKAIKEGINVRVEAGMERRVQVTVDEYFKPEWKEDIKSVIRKLRQKLGGEKTERLLQQMDDNEFEKVAETLLTDYYDPLYEHTVDNIDYDYKVNGYDEGGCVQELKRIKEKLE